MNSSPLLRLRRSLALAAALGEGNYHNNNEIGEMVTVVAGYEGVKKDSTLPSEGSGPILMLTAFAYAAPGKNVVTTAMSYTQLTRAFSEHGGNIQFAPLSETMGYDFAALSLTIDENTVIVYICNPNNPTGVLADPAELRKFILSVPPHILVFVDEAYLELADSGLVDNTAGPLVKVRKNMIISRIFSKGYAMAGLRAGYGMAHPDVLAKLRRSHTGGPSSLAAIAAQEAIKDKAHLEVNRKNHKDVRDYVCKEFDRLGIKYASLRGRSSISALGCQTRTSSRSCAMPGSSSAAPAKAACRRAPTATGPAPAAERKRK
jgi:histidinol-phosphate aminotransferase